MAGCAFHMKVEHQILNNFIIRIIKKLFDDTRTDDYINRCISSGCLITIQDRKRSSSIAGKISSAKIFAHDFSRAFFSRSVRAVKLSSKDNC